MKKGTTGASLGGNLELSPSRRKRAAEKRRREEQRWADKCGPVRVYYVDPENPSVRVVREDQDSGGSSGPPPQSR